VKTDTFSVKQIHSSDEKELNTVVKRTEKPLQSLSERKTSFNLKTIFDKVEEEKPVVEKAQDLPKQEFSEQDVLNCWGKFLQQLQTQHKVPAYNALHTGKVKLDDNFRILFEFNSASLVNEFDLEKDNLMRLMREKLNNHLIEFQTRINHSHSENYVKTKADIFNEMVKKNPILLKMKDEMGLDYNSNE